MVWIAPGSLPHLLLIELSQVGLYAMWGALESINLAVGRGKTNELAFKVIGAPWMGQVESQKLAKELNAIGRGSPGSPTVMRSITR